MTTKKRGFSSAEIAEFLFLNPDFFRKNPEVLNSIEIVHESGAATSLIQRQVELLRLNYNSTTDKLMEILGVAKNNEDIFSLTKKLILSLIGTSNVEEIVTLLEKSFETDFDSKSSRVLFFTEYSKNLPKARTRNLSKANKFLVNLLKPGEIYCGPIEQDVVRFIFDRKSTVTECALVPLTCNSLKGLIALGTDIPGKYDSKKDTLFLDFVSEVVSKLVDSHNV